MRASLAALAALVIGCVRPAPDFEVVGSVAVGAADQGSILALWMLPTEPPRLYKWGEGTSLGARFAIAFDDVPPDGAIDAGGVGVAMLVQLPGLATIPDGVVANPDSLRLTGISPEHAIVFKRGVAATGPAWAADLPLAYSCARCVRSTDGGLDTFELAPCFELTIEGSAVDTCNWY